MPSVSPSFTHATASEPSTAAIGNVSSRLAVGGKDGGVEMCDLSSGLVCWADHSHNKNEIDTIAFNATDELLACAGRDFHVVVRDSSSGEVVTKLRADGPVNQVQFSPSGDRVFAAGNSGRILLWDVFSGTQLGVFDGHEYHIWGISVSPRGDLLASAGWDCTARLWDIESQQQLARFGFDGSDSTSSFGAVYSTHFSPDGESFYASSQDRRVRKFDCQSMSQIGEFVLDDVPNCMLFNRDGTCLAAWCLKHSVWDTRSGKALLSLSALNSKQLGFGIGISNQGDLLVLPGRSGEVYVLSIAEQQLLHELIGGESDPICVNRHSYGLFWSHDDQQVALVETGERVLAWSGVGQE